MNSPADQPAPKREKVATRPGSKYAHGKRNVSNPLKTQPKGFARGARVR